MMVGTIVHVIANRGFGFIRPQGVRARGADYFFHERDLKGDLIFGRQLVDQDVAFEPAMSMKGPTASAVWPAEMDDATT